MKTPTLKVKYRVEVHDAKGNLVKAGKWKNSHSFVKNFGIHLYVLMAHKYNVASELITIFNTSNVSKYIRASTPATQSFFACLSDSGDAAYGIVAGLGTNPVDNDDYNLQTKCANGIGANQLQYGSHSNIAPVEIGTDIVFQIQRTVTNSSGATITLKEIGIIVDSQDSIASAQYFLVLRDLVNVEIPNTYIGTIAYKISTTP